MTPTPEQLKAAYEAARKFADESGYGGFISDQMCWQLSGAVAHAVLKEKSHG